MKEKKDKIISKANSLEGTDLEMALEKTSQISSRIQDAQSTLFKKNQNITKANWHLHGEMINKYWCAHGKEKKGHDTIMELCLLEPSPPQYTSNSQKMADEMAKFHQKTQNAQDDTQPTNREESIIEALQGMPNIPNHIKMNLDSLLTYNEIEHA